MYSMTGYGKGVASNNGKTVTIEIKTVNHRFLDWGLKLPKTFLFLEDEIKKAVGSKLSRGHVDVFVTYEQSALGGGVFAADAELAKNYLETAAKLQKATGLKDDLTLSALLKVPEIITRQSVPEDEALLRLLTFDALNTALLSLKDMRLNEGGALKKDLSSKLDAIASCLEMIAVNAPKVVDDYRAKLNARIAEAVNPGIVDENRLATEIALYADHCSIDEEITRLSAHIVNMRTLLDESEPVGRKLDFLVQEMNREANTIGSKANDLKITAEVLKIKNEIEKIREQTQNVE